MAIKPRGVWFAFHSMRSLTALGLVCAGAGGLCAAQGNAGDTPALRIASHGLALFGLKGTEKGLPVERTDMPGYLDHFVLEVQLEGNAGGEGARSQWKLAAWFGRATEEQLKVVFAKEEDRGKPYEVRDAQDLPVPPERPQNAKAIPFHAEPSNKTGGRANLSKGIGGAPVPLVAAEPGVRRLYSSMHQRFSFSLLGLEEKHFREFGARYSVAQMGKLPAGVYHLVLPFSAALIDGAGRVVAVRHGERRLVLDLTDQNRKETLESFQGSGAPRLTLEPAQAQNAVR